MNITLWPTSWRGPFLQVQMAVDVRFAQDMLRGDNVTEIRMKFIKRIEENLPAGDEWAAAQMGSLDMEEEEEDVEEEEPEISGNDDGVHLDQVPVKSVPDVYGIHAWECQ